MNYRRFLRRPTGEAVAVPRHEFVALLVSEEGMSQENAELQAKIAATLGSEVEIGGRVVRILREEGIEP